MRIVEAQIDRFMFRLTLGYPTADEEHDLIERLSRIQAFKVNQVGSMIMNIIDNVASDEALLPPKASERNLE